MASECHCHSRDGIRYDLTSDMQSGSPWYRKIIRVRNIPLCIILGAADVVRATHGQPAEITTIQPELRQRSSPVATPPREISPLSRVPPYFAGHANDVLPVSERCLLAAFYLVPKALRVTSTEYISDVPTRPDVSNVAFIRLSRAIHLTPPL